MQELADKNSWIKLVWFENIAINRFTACYKNDLGVKKVYLKLDDDTLWMDPKFLTTMF
jgi:hypothetical protein